MNQDKVYKCNGGTDGPWTYSVRKKCHYCRQVTGAEREAALKQMMLPSTKD